MPDAIGLWRYKTQSNVDELDGITGEIECTAPAADNHGPVRVIDACHFALWLGSLQP